MHFSIFLSVLGFRVVVVFLATNGHLWPTTAQILEDLVTLPRADKEHMSRNTHTKKWA